jgi:hypothetical protein
MKKGDLVEFRGKIHRISRVDTCFVALENARGEATHLLSVADKDLKLHKSYEPYKKSIFDGTVFDSYYFPSILIFVQIGLIAILIYLLM